MLSQSIGKQQPQSPTRLAEERLKQYVASGRSLTLTDDFVPVDQLLAGLFIERGNR